MPSSVILRRVALVRSDVSEECFASIIRMTGIVKLGVTLAVTRTDARCEEVLIRATRYNIPEDGILHSR
jgi:hypothetical protein